MAETVPTIGAKAPRPTRASFARSLYDAVEAARGPATLQEIIQLIPATDDAHKWDTAKPDRVLKLLIINKTAGYCVETPEGRWQLAPLAFYEKQQEHARDVREGRAQKRKPGKRHTVHEVTEYVHIGKWEGIAIGAIGAVVGMAIGVMIA